MVDYVSMAACRGIRPKPLGGLRLFSRPELVLRLAADRMAPRFLVAPAGSGKTMLACVYAETMFELNDVFWFDCESPCFLRDLDGRELDQEILLCNPRARLVVFDNLPPLSAVRAERFWKVLSNLSVAGCETLLAVTPSWYETCWLPAAAAGQWDVGKCCALFASELLVSEVEQLECRSTSEASGGERLRELASRVPAYVWGRAGETEDALRGFVRETLDPDRSLLVLAAEVLGQGDVSRLFGLLELPDTAEVRESLYRDYPMMGANRLDGSFAAMPVNLETAVKQLSFAVDSGRTSWRGTRDDLVQCLCDELLRQNRGGRGCQVAKTGLTRSRRTAWLSEHDDELLLAGCMEPGLDLSSCCRTETNAQGAGIHARAIWRLGLLGKADDALNRAARNAGMPWATPESRTLCGLAMVRFGEPAQREKGLNILKETAGYQQEISEPWNALAALALEVASSGLFPSLQFWMAWVEGSCFGADALIAAAAWLLREIGQAEDAHLLQPLTCDVKEFLLMLQPMLETQCELQGSLSLFGSEAFRQMGVLQRRLGLQGMFPETGLLTLAASVRALETDIASQQRRLEGTFPESDGSREGGRLLEEGHTEPLLRPPVLSVRLFGCVSAEIGGVSVNDQLLRRRKVQTLLVLLVLELGHAVSVDKLAASLWPGRDVRTARRNFYSTWSLLKRALTLPQGGCPYLIRLQGACKLDERLVVSDVRQVDEFCRALHVDTPDPEGWLQLLESFEDICASELCPNEQENEIVRNAREAYSTRIVDALVAAGNRLLLIGEPRAALWFARRAYARTSRREDVYLVLMRAQLSSGQRTMALETYMKCLRFLGDELGMDPSVEMTRMYEEVLGCLEADGWPALEPAVPPATFVRCSTGHSSTSSRNGSTSLRRGGEAVPSQGIIRHPLSTIR